MILAGGFNTITENLYKLLGNDYNIQLGTAQASSLKGVLELTKAEILLIVATGLDPEHRELFEIVERVNPRLPVVVVGTKNEIEQFADCVERKEVTVIYRPVQIKTIKDTISNILGIVMEDKYKKDNRYANQFKKRIIRRILLVDDSQIQLRTMNNLLKNEFSVYMAESGKEALQVLPQFQPDLIFLDYSMPGLDGRETLKRIREAGYEDIPVVFLTGVKEKKRIRSVLEMNPAGYLLKPVKQDRLFDLLDALSVDQNSNVEDTHPDE